MKHSMTAAGLVALAFLAGCASPEYRSPEGQAMPPAYPGTAQSGYPGAQQAYTIGYGTVQSIQQVSAPSAGGVGWGTVGGGVVGGLLGHQVGGGTGKTAATVAGAVGGAALGQHMQNQNRGSAAYQIVVRLDNGNLATVTQDSVANMQIGSRVRVDSNNRVYPY
jgi:outer membrane lipoprotein SlyB